MLIIGERINATRKAVRAAIERRDEAQIAELATSQAEAGADYIDVNGGDPREGAEAKNMEWLVNLVQAHTDKPIAVDSANPEAVKVGLELARNKPIVNSISLEADRLRAMLPVVADAECMVVALCMADEGTPTGVDDRVSRARDLVAKLTDAGKKPEEIIVDPCFFPVSADPANGKIVCRAIGEIRKALPGVYVGGGLSNCSFGLPQRKLINLAMIVAGVYKGMSAAIVDPCVPGLVPAILAAEVVSGADDWCANYIAAYREGKLA